MLQDTPSVESSTTIDRLNGESDRRGGLFGAPFTSSKLRWRIADLVSFMLKLLQATPASMSYKPKPISVQLYSLRDDSSRNFDSVLERLAQIGYQGVEPFALFGKKPEEFLKQVKGLGMEVSSSHHPWANRSDINEVIDVTKGLGLSRAAGGFGPDDFKSADAVKQTVETVNLLVEQLGRADLELFLHNHWFEFIPVEGELPYHTLQRECPGVLFEVDTYWAANFGSCDPVEEVRRIRHRAPLLHIKDGPLESGRAHVAVGSGILDIAGIAQAADPDVLDWLIVELDSCDTDMFEAVQESYRFLISSGLATGNVAVS